MKTSSPAAVVARGSSISSAPGPLAIGKLGLATVLAMYFLAASAAAQSTTIVISEFRTRGPGGVTDEFIEIYNKSCASVAIGGFKRSQRVVRRLRPDDLVERPRVQPGHAPLIKGFSTPSSRAESRASIDVDRRLRIVGGGDHVVFVTDIAARAAIRRNG